MAADRTRSNAAAVDDAPAAVAAAAPTAAQLRQARVDDRDAVAIIVRRQCIVSDSDNNI